MRPALDMSSYILWIRINLRRCCCIQSRYRELVGVVNWEDDPLISMVEVNKQLPAKWRIATHTYNKNKLFMHVYLEYNIS